jgi:DNA-binding PadR family transcriptional regulator
MPKENTTTYIILGLLNHEDLSGYDIKKKIDYMISKFWEVGYSQIYPTLRQMEQEKLVTKHLGEISKGPEKSSYSITEAGREALKEWLAIPNEKEYTKYEILLKLFFGSLVSLKDNTQRIEAFKERHLQNLNMIKMYKSNLEKVIDETDDHLYYYLTVLFGEHIYKAYLEWAEEATKLLSNKERDISIEDKTEGDGFI